MLAALGVEPGDLARLETLPAEAIQAAAATIAAIG